MSNASGLNPWRLNKCVLPQHTDHAGVMWHGAYLNWLEEARIEALREVGLTYKDLSEKGFEMPVVSLEINYLRALTHGENVLLESWCLPRKGVRWAWETSVFNDLHCLSAKAKVELVLVRKISNGTRLLRKVPDDLSRFLIALEKGPSLHQVMKLKKITPMLI